MTIEQELGRISGQLDILMRASDKAEESRKKTHEEIETIRLNQERTNNRLKIVEDSISKNAPTIEEFITIKHKVVGAGAMGKWLWVAGSFLLGAAFAIRTNIESLLK